MSTLPAGKKYRCMGLSIIGTLQTNCPVRLTCQHFINPGEAKQPSTNITSAGCSKYQRISKEEFAKGWRV